MGLGRRLANTEAISGVVSGAKVREVTRLMDLTVDVGLENRDDSWDIGRLTSSFSD